jgi:4-amino-4-deoxy-L-arabinose transferase-like glycosyltransferase
VRVVLYALVVVALWGVTQLWGLGGYPFHTHGEPREALVVWEMTHGGGWILPRRNGVELPDKPPLFHWLAAVTSLLQGQTDEWSVRFPSAVLSLATTLSVFAAASVIWNPRAALLGAVILLTNIEWTRASVNARVDMTYAAYLSLALLSLLFFLRTRRPAWLPLMYGATALAVLAKGPLAAVMVAFVAVATVLALRRPEMLLRLRPATGFVLVTGIAALWYVPALLLGGTALLQKQGLHENVYHFIEQGGFDVGHEHSAGYLAVALVLNLLPWTIFLPAVAGHLWRHRASLARTLAWPLLLVWICTFSLVHGLAFSKRSVYLLPVFPALAMLIGAWWDEQIRSPQPLKRFRAFARGVCLALVTVATAGALALGATALVPMETWQSVLPNSLHPVAVITARVLSAHPLSVSLGVLTFLLGLWTSSRALRSGSWRATFAAVAGAAVAVIWLTQYVVLPEVAVGKTQRDFASGVRQATGSGVPVFFHGSSDYGILFYAGQHIPVYDGALTDQAPRYLIVKEDTWEQLQRASDVPFEQVPLRADQRSRLGRRFILLRRVNP